jgi:hypothetical protein
MVPSMDGVFQKLRKLKAIAEESIKQAHETEHQGLAVGRAAQQKANESDG